jgi:enoyl-CoA hydratase/carnithine racemase
VTEILYDVRDRVALITLNRPEKLNAWTPEMSAGYRRALDDATSDPSVRAVVLTGAGRGFCAGADMNLLGDLAETGARVGGGDREPAQMEPAVPKPVIAAVNGAAIGAGCVLALVSDILVIAEEAYMSMTEVDYGLAGGVRHVLRSFSPSDARLMIYTAKRMSGADLYRMNVASACAPRERVVAEAQAIGKTIAEKVPLAVVAAKRSFGLTEELPLRDGYRYEQSQTAALAETEDTKEALAAFREKRKPVFKGR